MLTRPPFQTAHDAEGFLLAVLHVLEGKLDRSKFIVKGGMNLRAWFGSQRYSEDLDLDIVRIEPFALRDVMDRVLTAPLLRSLLASQRLSLVRVSRPKQTDTTQRWKFEIASLAGETVPPIATKLDINRRGADEGAATEPLLAQVRFIHGLPAIVATHYAASKAIQQKIHALAARRDPKARDVWDLEHLFRTTVGDPRPLPDALARLVPEAIERTLAFTFEDYRDQVLPFLTEEAREIYTLPQHWDAIRELVLDRLMGLSP
jgi:hypothetical protein